MSMDSAGIVLSGVARKLVNDGLLNDATAKQAILAADEQHIPVLQHLVENNHINSTNAANHLANEFGLPLFDLNQFDLDSVDSMPVQAKSCINEHFIPILQRSNRLYVAISDPTRTSIFDRIKFESKLNPFPILVEEHKLIVRLNQLSQSFTSAALDKIDDLGPTHLETTHDDEFNQDISSVESDDAPVVQFINKIILDAINKGASDIHFEPYEKKYRVRFRIDGILREIATPTNKLAQRFAARIKVMARLDLSERRIPQDGRFKLKISANRTIDFRVSTCPTLFGEKVVLRILDSSNSILDIDKLGMTESHKQLLLDIIKHPQGMVLVTGPTGSGKTVTLYTCLNILNVTGKNISTVEDPVEINLQGINQVHVNNKTGLTFAAALRSFLRQDPDIVMVGEIRDLETAEIAIKAAQTGHMVFSTLHTNSAAETLTRLANMGVPSFNIATSVSLIVAQRLARRLCDQCKQPANIPQSALLQAGFDEADLANVQIFEPNGCENCNGGYRGRIGIYEMLPMSERIGHAIMEGGNALQIGKIASEEKVKTLRQSGLDMVLAGVTSLAEVERVTID